jgi:hypothetical protein
MTFLKKLGGILVAGLGLFTGIWPLLKNAIPGASTNTTVATVENDFTKVANVIVGVEATIAAISDPNAKTGAQKLQAAAGQVAGIIRASELISGKKIANEALFIEGSTDVTNGFAKILNSIHPDAAQPAKT